MRVFFLAICLSWILTAQDKPEALQPLAVDGIAQAGELIGLEFNEQERKLMAVDLAEQRQSYKRLRQVVLENAVSPALTFNPGAQRRSRSYREGHWQWSPRSEVTAPDDIEQLAFADIGTLGALLREGKVTSVDLTRMCIARLKRYDPQLKCVISLLEERALRAAEKADKELAEGRDRGPLHGIPCGVKDLFAMEGTRTTWGATPFKDQVLPITATAVARLEEAGAVVVVKLSLGALAWGDVWFGGTTKNPWNLDEGSSGSSAGSAAAVSAGLVPFALGTETWGSIVSPSARCGVTGLRPTFGRVSRHGAMALSWSMDKIGPIARSVEDCAMVMSAIIGPDGKDDSVFQAPFAYRPNVDLSKLKIGYVPSFFEAEYEGRDLDRQTLSDLEKLGATLIPIQLPSDLPIDDLAFVLSAEAGAAFDQLTRSGQDDLMVRQIRAAWPNVLRASRFIPAVEYINANRVRNLLIAQMVGILEGIDVYLTPSFSPNLLLTNLTGHPSIQLPNGMIKPHKPHGITFTANLFEEDLLLAVAKAYQDATGHHLPQPPDFAVSKAKP